MGELYIVGYYEFNLMYFKKIESNKLEEFKKQKDICFAMTLDEFHGGLYHLI